MGEGSSESQNAYTVEPEVVKQILRTRAAPTLPGYAVTMPDAPTVAARLAAWRKATGLSQGDFGEKLGKNQSWVSRIENGGTIEVDEIEAWARACGVSARMDWGASSTEVPVMVAPDRADALRRLSARSPADLDLLARAADLLDTAPTARDRLAFEVNMWQREAHDTQVRAAIREAMANQMAALTGDDAAAARLLQQRAGLAPTVPPVAPASTSRSKQ